ncbi:MAG TPA: lipopolysaccharide assembly protein LapA domain-containing protein [Actinophytocola sp.]|jgi:uncharacterized integral membrane protein|uniref:LapA family protein n=1 Tax=Actinophytocola sp. TaxID=1872138 RepID=UPI002F94BBC8
MNRYQSPGERPAPGPGDIDQSSVVPPFTAPETSVAKSRQPGDDAQGRADQPGNLTPSPQSAPDAVGTPPTNPASVGRSRFGGLWVGLVIAAAILVLLLIFVIQNSQTVQVDYFGFSGQLPLAVAILLGVAAGGLLVAIPGTVRILQLRKRIHHT